MGAVLSSLAPEAFSGLTSLLGVGVLGWCAAAALGDGGDSSTTEPGHDWRSVRVISSTPATGGGCNSNGRDKANSSSWRIGDETKVATGRRHRHDDGTAASWLQAVKNSGRGGGLAGTATVSGSLVALASASQEVAGAARNDDDDGECDDSLERSGRSGAVRRRAATKGVSRGAQLGESPGTSAQLVQAYGERLSLQQQSVRCGCERTQTSGGCGGGKSFALAGFPAAAAVAAARKCASETDANCNACARSAARSSPCRFYYCSSSLRTNAGDDRASASRMLAAAAATNKSPPSTTTTIAKDDKITLTNKKLNSNRGNNNQLTTKCVNESACKSANSNLNQDNQNKHHSQVDAQSTAATSSPKSTSSTATTQTIQTKSTTKVATERKLEAATKQNHQTQQEPISSRRKQDVEKTNSKQQQIPHWNQQRPAASEVEFKVEVRENPPDGGHLNRLSIQFANWQFQETTTSSKIETELAIETTSDNNNKKRPIADCASNSFKEDINNTTQFHQFDQHQPTAAESEFEDYNNCPLPQLHQQKFAFERGHICAAREQRSLSTCSTLTTESSGTDSPRSSGYSSPGAISLVSSVTEPSSVPFAPVMSLDGTAGGGGELVGEARPEGRSTAIVRCQNKRSHRRHHVRGQNSLDVVMEPPAASARQRSIVIKARQNQFASKSSAASSLDSGHSGSSNGSSHQDLTSNNLLHPTVSALLQSTANLTLSKHHHHNYTTNLYNASQQPALVVDVHTPPPSPLKRSKKMQVLNGGDQHNNNRHPHQFYDYQMQQAAVTNTRGDSQSLSECSASSTSCSPISIPPPGDRSQLVQSFSSPFTQDATYLSPAPDRGLLQNDDHLRRYLTELNKTETSGGGPPPRPWLSPAQQLHYLSKGKLKQLFQAGRLERDQYDRLLEARSRKFATSRQKQKQQRQQPSTISSNRASIEIDADVFRRNQPTNCHRSTGNEFTVFSYNVLSDRMVKPEQFPSSPSLALNWLYRSELIMRQLQDHDADIVALQELEMEQYEHFFKPKLEELGNYCSLFESKSRARTMDLQRRRRVDGCAIFFKRDKFNLVGQHLLEFNQIAMANSQGSEAMLNRVMIQDNIGLVAVLELVDKNSPSQDQHQKQSDSGDLECSNGSDSGSGSLAVSNGGNRSTSRRLIICNTHIHWNPEYCDVKLVQTIMMMNELKYIARLYSNGAGQLDELPQQATSDGDIDDDLNGSNSLVPLVLLGDFNSLQKSGVVQYLLDGNIDSSHKDFKEFNYTQCSTALTSMCLRRRWAPTNNNHEREKLVNRRGSHQQQPSTLVKRQLVDSSSLQTGAYPAGQLTSHLTSSASSIARRQSSPITCVSSATPPPETYSPPTVSALAPSNSADNKSKFFIYEHPFKLASAYENGVMPFTNYCTHFKATIDYIFYDYDQLELLGSLGPLDKDWLKQSKLKGFPQMNFPSDHLPLMAKFKLLAIQDDDRSSRCDDDDVYSSISQLSSIETLSASIEPNFSSKQQPDRVEQRLGLSAKTKQKKLLVVANQQHEQQRNQRKQQHVFNNSNQQKKQQHGMALPNRQATNSTSDRVHKDTTSVWHQLRRDPTQPAGQHQFLQRINNNNQLAYQQQIRQQAKQSQMQMDKERREFFINNNNNNNDSQQTATSKRSARQLRRQQLHKKLLKPIRLEEAWHDVPLLVKLKEDWS